MSEPSPERVWRAVSEKGSLHLGELTVEAPGAFRFVTRCDRVHILGAVFDDPKRHRCKICLDHEATRDRNAW